MWQINYPVSNLVSCHQGTLRVLIACPHGGDAIPENVPERSGQTTPPGCNFKKASDSHTRDIAVGVAQRVPDVFGQAPYFVIAESQVH
jgi:hypothetical protein